MEKNAEVRMQNAARMRPARSTPVFVLTSAFCILTFLAGCTYQSTSPPPASMKQKQEAVVRDPINYKPDNETTDPYDITGGSINNLDRDAFKRDLDHVFSP